MDLSTLNAQTFRQLVGDLGFTLLPPLHPGSPGYDGLLVVIRKKPTDKHFDPNKLILPLYNEEDEIDWKTLSILSLPEADRICPGRVILADRLDKQLEFFTFGGQLKVMTEGEDLLCAIGSPAPILELVEEEETVANWLAAESEAVWAEVRAAWGIQDEEFERRLARADPLALYTATLHTILSRWERNPALQEAHQHLWDALSQEKHWLKTQGLWPDKPLTAEDLLAPDYQ